jgi:hypothetical protein
MLRWYRGRYHDWRQPNVTDPRNAIASEPSPHRGAADAVIAHIGTRAQPSLIRRGAPQRPSRSAADMLVVDDGFANVWSSPPLPSSRMESPPI